MKHLLFFILSCAAVIAAHAQSSAFSYQGRLAANGSPYTGFAEMQFALFSSPTGGVAVAASTPATAGVNVSGGLFTTSLDFGAAAFPGADRWLEVQVRTNLGAFTTLTPRQPLTPTPYALYARTAGTAGPWSSTASNAFYNGGNVGVGTAAPIAGLHVKKEATAPGGTLALEGDTLAAMTFFPNGVPAGRKGYFGFASPNTTDITIANENATGRIVLQNPSSGAVFATGGEENLRIIRGSVIPFGINNGSGFTVTRISEGDYRIDFLTRFSSPPSVTATADDEVESFTLFDFFVASIFESSTSSVRVRIRAQSDTAQLNGPSDRKFYFIAIGPR